MRNACWTLEIGSAMPLEELQSETERYTGPFELPEPGEGEVAWVRETVERQHA